MKIAIVYYSRSGNTKKAAHYLEKRMKEQKHDVHLIEIEAEKRLSFLRAGRAGMKQDPLPIINGPVDMKSYGVILVGMPVWAAKPAPYYRTFFDNAKNIKGKTTGMFFTQAGKDNGAKSFTIMKEYLSSQEMKPLDSYLVLQMRKKEILGEVNDSELFMKQLLKAS